mgnify:CR=1 FL=1
MRNMGEKKARVLLFHGITSVEQLANLYGTKKESIVLAVTNRIEKEDLEKLIDKAKKTLRKFNVKGWRKDNDY